MARTMKHPEFKAVDKDAKVKAQLYNMKDMDATLRLAAHHLGDTRWATLTAFRGVDDDGAYDPTVLTATLGQYEAGSGRSSANVRAYRSENQSVDIEVEVLANGSIRVRVDADGVDVEVVQ